SRRTISPCSERRYQSTGAVARRGCRRCIAAWAPARLSPAVAALDPTETTALLEVEFCWPTALSTRRDALLTSACARASAGPHRRTRVDRSSPAAGDALRLPDRLLRRGLGSLALATNRRRPRSACWRGRCRGASALRRGLEVRRPGCAPARA